MIVNVETGYLQWRWPRHGYGRDPELELIEVGERAANTYDESSPLMHRIINAVGGEYDVTHNLWFQAGMARHRQYVKRCHQ